MEKQEIVEKILDFKEPSDNFYKELEIYRDYNGETKESVVEQFKFNTVFGKVVFKKMLSNMSTDINLLKARQMILKDVWGTKLSTSKIIWLQELNNLIPDFLWFWEEHSEETDEYLSSAYFTNEWLLFLNHPIPLQVLSWYKIFTSPIVNVLIPILTIIGTYITFRIMGFKLDVSTFFRLITMFIPQLLDSRFGSFGKYGPLIVWLFFYLSNIYNTLKASYDHYKLCADIHRKVERYNQAVILMNRILWNKSMDIYMPNTTYYGTTISGYLELRNSKRLDVVKMIKAVGEIDTFISLSNDLGTAASGGFCLVELETKGPIMEFEALWHPYLDREKSIKNDLSIRDKKGVMITGPNANGKSMYVKAIGINIILSQTFGIACAKSGTITPFKLFETYINIPDHKGKESLFEAEIHRCRDYLNRVKRLSKGEYSLILVDEIFTGTNAKESISGAYAVCRKLGRLSGNIAIITTHYNYLTKLKEYNNYKMPVNIEGDKIEYTYKITQGISDQFIAIDLLEKKGLDKDIVRYAKKISKKLNHL